MKTNQQLDKQLQQALDLIMSGILPPLEPVVPSEEEKFQKELLAIQSRPRLGQSQEEEEEEDGDG